MLTERGSDWGESRLLPAAALVKAAPEGAFVERLLQYT